MKLSKLFPLFVLLALAGGFAYFASMDVPVEKGEITQTIPNERFGLDGAPS